MVKIYDYSDYREFLGQLTKDLKKGSKAKLSASLGIQPSMFSQILNRKKALPLEKAVLMGKFLGFSENEIKYLICLIQMDNAGTEELRQLFKNEAVLLRMKGEAPVQSENYFNDLNSVERSIFFSSWQYVGVHLLSSLPNQTVESAATRFQLPVETVNQVVDFLSNCGLCSRKGRQIQTGPSRIFIEGDTLNRARHHQNWRFKGVAKLAEAKTSDYFLSYPMSLSEADARLIRMLIQGLVSKAEGIYPESKPEKLFCLNVDWFEF